MVNRIEQPEARLDGLDVAGPASRRRFLKLASIAGGAAAVSGFLLACGGSPTGEDEANEEQGQLAPADRDLEIVNYALFLEYLEEQFYDEVRKSGEISDSRIRRLVELVYTNEAEHAEALEALATQLGGVPVDRPRTDFTKVLAGGQSKILTVAAEVENLGASAYLGQAALVSNDFVLEAALTVHTVEARHAAAFNELAGNGFRASKKLRGSVPHGAFAKPRSQEEVLRIATDFVKT
ncbi:MAG TPA: ferritin-like domain-containing protein [Thermoleophilaceae bacterium]|nr:ferritin-like domain-containing protein [Thermoleophilaceae bacterium]